MISHRLDLPPAWDGVPVEWSEWSKGNTTLVHHIPLEQLACGECGALDEPSVSFGKRPVAAGETLTATRTKTTKRGDKYEVPYEVPAWPVRDLIASRCRHCNHDVVTDLRTNERWDLEDGDYTPLGSYPSGLLF